VGLHTLFPELEFPGWDFQAKQLDCRELDIGWLDFRALVWSQPDKPFGNGGIAPFCQYNRPQREGFYRILNKGYRLP
jgi:hypothetical protein